VPRAVVPILLEPLIASFCQAYPEVEVEIAASKELIDLQENAELTALTSCLAYQRVVADVPV
jgi:DNA-binding transcriptional LysR family regulator